MVGNGCDIVERGEVVRGKEGMLQAMVVGCKENE